MGDRTVRGAWLAAWLAAAVGLAHPAEARAGAFEVAGAGPTGVAEVGARAARADDGTAAFYNPAGLAMGSGVRLDVAPLVLVSALSLQGREAPVEDPFGVVLAADATVPFTGLLKDRLRAGAALYLPPSNAIHLVVPPPDQPQMPYFANRTQRLVAMVALALRIARPVSIGVGANVLGGVQGPVDVRPGASGTPEPRLSVDATTQAALHAGARVDLTDRVHLAAAYRQQFSVPILITTVAEIGGITLASDADVRHALFDPHTFVLGAAFDAGRAELEMDISYSVWSAYDGPALGVRAELPGALLTSEPRRALFRDVVAVRGAASYAIDVGRRSGIVLRAGAGFEPPILATAPQGLTNFADGPKLFGGAGASLSLRDVLPLPVRIGAGLGVTGVLESAVEKRACLRVPCPAGTVAGPDPSAPSEGIVDPGFPVLRSGGALFTASFGVGVDL